eukprot:CAMPEP_0179151924 /NCGR_PEP_ID=MMETSP0796-20121207/73799_1 /TAXON_ID=73915 /ORGANISM="Pyrodinium bahamense, Strain pbaha01" /LENGTH=121 /DNA_ID=CAMNT_0020853087 /DNA_START=36 /DNA_END=398 /DNA_ORIENTATION=+
MIESKSSSTTRRCLVPLAEGGRTCRCRVPSVTGQALAARPPQPPARLAAARAACSSGVCSALRTSAAFLGAAASALQACSFSRMHAGSFSQLEERALCRRRPGALCGRAAAFCWGFAAPLW